MEKIINYLITTNLDKKVADVVACLSRDAQIIACKHLLGIESMVFDVPKHSKPMADDANELYGVGTLVNLNPLEGIIDYKCDYTSVRYVKTEEAAAAYNNHKYVDYLYKKTDEYPIKATKEYKDEIFRCSVKEWCDNAIPEMI